MIDTHGIKIKTTKQEVTYLFTGKDSLTQALNFSRRIRDKAEFEKLILCLKLEGNMVGIQTLEDKKNKRK